MQAPDPVESVYEKALKHIHDGDNLGCQTCGHLGSRKRWLRSGIPLMIVILARCPICGGKTQRITSWRIAFSALKYGEKQSHER